MGDTDNTRIGETILLPTPLSVKEGLELTPEMQKFIEESRQVTSDILHGKDGRRIVISGPCSIHNRESAIEYAEWLAEMQKQYTNLYFIMRVYFEKPRTTVGWKGLINDPHLDGTYDITEGIVLAREIFHRITELGVPIATEQLDTLSPQYTSDLVTYSAIGARTTESQPHREMASGLSSPVGFKNGGSGDTKIAVDGMKAAMKLHRFMGINEEGQASIIPTMGNPDAHVILRGGREGPNYKKGDILQLEEDMRERDVEPIIIVDGSHGNAEKDYKNQLKVSQNIATQIIEGNMSVRGIMLESHLDEGQQSVDIGNTPLSKINPKQSMTDPCIGLDDTEKIFETLNDAIGKIIIKNEGLKA